MVSIRLFRLFFVNDFSYRNFILFSPVIKPIVFSHETIASIFNSFVRIQNFYKNIFLFTNESSFIKTKIHSRMKVNKYEQFFSGIVKDIMRWLKIMNFKNIELLMRTVYGVYLLLLDLKATMLWSIGKQTHSNVCPQMISSWLKKKSLYISIPFYFRHNEGVRYVIFQLWARGEFLLWMSIMSSSVSFFFLLIHSKQGISPLGRKRLQIWDHG